MDAILISVAQVVLLILKMYTWVIIGNVIFSWLFAFNVINSHNQFVNMIARTLYSLTEPVMRPIRNVLPNMGGLDLSPIVVLIGIFFLQNLIFNLVFRGGF